MVYLRSEEHLHRWLEETGYEPGATFPATTMNELAKRWWSSRLDPEWSPRSVQESQAILDEIGLTADFWRLG
jgi:hypothetical protein